MFGFLNIYKPKGITSHDVIYRVRKILNIKKVGHAGTLDPLAEGVLPVAIGGATRLIDYLPTDKEYLADVKFGYTSDTFDSEGKIEKVSDDKVDEDNFLNALNNFCGDIVQKPPIYSAVKVNGQKLYDYARKGVETEIPERIIRVDYIKSVAFNKDENTAKLLIGCSKGTYIRSIINDLGNLLKSGAYMTGLVRTLSSGMRAENSVKIDDISPDLIIPPNDLLKFPEIEINEKDFAKVKNGNSIKINCGNGLIFITFNGNIVSLAEVTDGIAYSKKVFL